MHRESNAPEGPRLFVEGFEKEAEPRTPLIQQRSSIHLSRESYQFVHVIIVRRPWATVYDAGDECDAKPRLLWVFSYDVSPRALSSLVRVEPGYDLSDYDFKLSLSNVLMSVAAARTNESEALELKELAHSFAHDGLNLAVLAARMLWHEGITPDESRSSDLPVISVDTQCFFVTLQTACDIMVQVIRRFGGLPGKSGQVKRTDSFHSFNEWAKKNPQRLRQEFRFVGEDLPWFNTLNALRTALVHRGGDSLVYTDRFRLSMAVVPFGRLGTRRHGDTDNYRARVRPLIPLLREQTRSVFRFSDQLAAAVRSVENLGRETQTAVSHVISGIYVPALHQMEKYKEPTDRAAAKIAAVGLLGVCDCLNALRLGYPDGYWWKFFITLSLGLKAAPEYVSVPGFNPGGALIEWYLLFRVGDDVTTICARDAILDAPDWIQHVLQDLNRRSLVFEARSNILVARSLLKTENRVQDLPENVIVGSDGESAAQLAIQYLTGTHPKNLPPTSP
jgi:hypothetical protein